LARWAGYTGDYIVRLSPVKGLPESDFRLNLNLQAPPLPSPESPSPIDTLPPTEEPEIETTPLNLSLGSPSEFSDRASNKLTKRYLVDAQPGQILSVEVLEGKVSMNVRYPSGDLVEGGSGVRNWSGRIFDQGSYQIDVVAERRSSFSLKVLLDDRPQ
jgi:hypothetical protein